MVPRAFSQYNDDDYNDYVREVLEEDYRNDDDYENPYATDQDEERMRQQQQEAERRRMAEAERLEREKADKIQQQREAQFEAELSRMSEEKRKLAKKQKRQDAKIVKRVINAAKKEQHYAVLGLRNWELRLPSRSIKIAKWKLTIPGIELFHISPNQIRKSYRSRAIAVHPDKNRDGRANEAFIAVENSASILSDTKLRSEYDELLRVERSRQRQELSLKAAAIRDAAFGAMRKTFALFRTILGPFAFPVLILGALII